jgi:hypothetical protein
MACAVTSASRFGASGRTDLIGDHLELIAFARQAQHGARKVVAARGVHPTGAKNQVFGAGGGDRLFAGELALTVDAQRRGGVAFLPGLLAAACEYVVGRVVHQPGAEAAGFLGEHAGSQGVERSRQFGFRLGLVDRRVGGGIDDHVRCDRAHAGCQAGEVSEAAAQFAIAFVIQGDHGSERSQAALQLPADLSALAEEQDFHGSRPP